MKIGVYDVQLKEYYDPYLARWTWIEAYKNGRKVKRLETLEKLSKEYFKGEKEMIESQTIHQGSPKSKAPERVVLIDNGKDGVRQPDYWQSED